MIPHNKFKSLMAQLCILVSAGVVEGVVWSIIRHFLVITAALTITGLPVTSRHYKHNNNLETVLKKKYDCFTEVSLYSLNQSQWINLDEASFPGLQAGAVRVALERALEVVSLEELQSGPG